MEPLQVAEHLEEKFPEAVVSTAEFRGQASVTLNKDALLEVCNYLYSTPEMGFNYLRDLTAVDYLGKRDVRFEVVYHLYSINHKSMLRLNVPVEESDCTVDSLCSIWEVANWHERECFDLFGVKFNGHPDMRRILMPDDWEGHPLRKDYPVKGPDKENEWPGYQEVLDKSERLKEFEWNR